VPPFPFSVLLAAFSWSESTVGGDLSYAKDLMASLSVEFAVLGSDESPPWVLRLKPLSAGASWTGWIASAEQRVPSTRGEARPDDRLADRATALPGRWRGWCLRSGCVATATLVRPGSDQLRDLAVSIARLWRWLDGQNATGKSGWLHHGVQDAAQP